MVILFKSAVQSVKPNGEAKPSRSAGHLDVACGHVGADGGRQFVVFLGDVGHQWEKW